MPGIPELNFLCKTTRCVWPAVAKRFNGESEKWPSESKLSCVFLNGFSAVPTRDPCEFRRTTSSGLTPWYLTKASVSSGSALTHLGAVAVGDGIDLASVQLVTPTQALLLKRRVVVENAHFNQSIFTDFEMGHPLHS